MAESEFLHLQEVVKAHIEKAVRLADGNLSRAAELLDVGRSTIYRKYRVTGATRVSATKVKARMLALEAALEAASKEPSDAYELGIANGLIQARHIMQGRSGTPSYL